MVDFAGLIFRTSGFKIFVLICFGIILILFGCASFIDFIANRFFLPVQGVREASYDVWTERGIGFTTSDSIQLLADIHHPKGLEKTPAILVRIPFTKTFWKSSPIGRRRALLGVPWIYGCGSGNARQI